MRLVEERHLDALSIAASFWSELEPDARRALGRILVDASTAADAGPDEPGARIRLEGPRTIWFGRSPRAENPGELPSAVKWQNLALALEATDRAGRAWDLVDLRWDEPELVFADAAGGSAASEAGGAR